MTAAELRRKWRATCSLSGVTKWSVAVDVFHALAMAAWILGLPLLFTRRWRTATRFYAVYAITFVIVSQTSQLVLGECFLTTVARWAEGAGSSAHPEWFTVRLARWVFGMAPSRRAISVTFDALVLVTAVGTLVRAHLHRPGWWRKAQPPPHSTHAQGTLRPRTR
ncbi:MAG: hypothetical protein IPJ34_31020 [Myxococcales bacterium]|nr:hypothetical protein [Myxococcales bacterium]